MKERCGAVLAADGLLDGATVWPTHQDHSQDARAGPRAIRFNAKRATARAAVVVVVAANLGIPGDTPINAQLSLIDQHFMPGSRL